MSGRSVLCLLAIFVVIAGATSAAAQDDSPVIPQSALGIASELLQPQRRCSVGRSRSDGPDALPAHRLRPVTFPEIARAAGTIFSGTVTAINRHPATAASRSRPSPSRSMWNERSAAQCPART